MQKRTTLILAVLLALAPLHVPAAPHSFEFVAEHLPEVAMDNRFATLPLSGAGPAPAGSWQVALQAGVTRTGSGGLTLDGPMWSVGLQRQMNDQWSVHAFGFVDAMHFSGSGEHRPLEILFASPPLALPAMAEFTDLRGTYRHVGAGVALGMKAEGGLLGARQWIGGVITQRVELRGYRAAYRVLEGPSSGASGFTDYSGNYAHFTPFAGLSLPRHFGAWSVEPHALLAIPFPRRGIQGRIAGTGFDLSGATDKAGHGKHFGDISVTLGLNVTYRPWNLTCDLGSVVSQALLERVIHQGIDRNWLVSVVKRF